MQKATRVVIVHGSYGSPEENWFPWLASQLRKDGHNVVVPKFPTPNGQNFASWREVFRTEVGPLNSNMVLVGHSAAAGFLLKLLQESKEPVKGTYLVSGFLGSLGLKEFDPINESLVSGDFDWPKIRANSGRVRIYNSDNDPYVPVQKGHDLAEKLGLALTVIKGAGHINASAGYTDFPQLLADIRDLLNEPKAK